MNDLLYRLRNAAVTSQLCLEAITEIEQLRACLPKTADGVPITASDVVYSKRGESTRLSWQVMHCAHLYYSTPDAAEAARAAGGGDGFE